MDLIQSKDQVIQRIIEYNDELKTNLKLQRNLKMAKHFFYDPVSELVGPSKFVGFSKSHFTSSGSLEGDGRLTQRRLLRFFSEPTPNSIESEKIRSKVLDLCSSYSLSPNKAFKVYIPNGWRMEPDIVNTTSVDLISEFLKRQFSIHDLRLIANKIT
tara:strand:- start:2640 stop:3110 length:471 start_codon:yes stop_codon:yes gene_type:complete